MQQRIRHILTTTAIGCSLLYLLYIGVQQSGYAWQWYRVWEYILIFEDGTVYAGDFLYGLKDTIYIVICSLILSLLFGIVLAAGRISSGKIANFTSSTYITVFRNTPILAQIYIFYFLIAPIFNMDRWVVGVLALSLYEASFVGEILRGAIQSVSNRQWEAGRSLNLSTYRIVTRIIFPQALRIVIAPLTNVAINLLKHSSIVSVIAIYELTTTARDAISDTFLTLEIWIIIACFYWLLAAIFATISRRVEKSIKWIEV